MTRDGDDEGGAGIGVAGPMVGDFAEPVTALDAFNFATLHVTGVEVNMKVRRGLRQAFLLKGTAPDAVRRGRTVRVRLRVHEVRGERSTRTIEVRVPRGMPEGERLLTLEGAPADSGGGLELDPSELLFGAEEDEESFDEAGPGTVKALARVVARIARYDGVQASFAPPDEDDASLDDLGDEPDGPEAVARRRRRVLRDPDLRLSGTVEIPVDVE